MKVPPTFKNASKEEKEIFLNQLKPITNTLSSITNTLKFNSSKILNNFFKANSIKSIKYDPKTKEFTITYTGKKKGPDTKGLSEFVSDFNQYNREKTFNSQTDKISYFCGRFNPSTTPPTGDTNSSYLTKETVNNITNLLLAKDDQKEILDNLGIKGVERVDLEGDQIVITKEEGNTTEPISLANY